MVFKHSALRVPSGLGPLPVFGLFCLCLPVYLAGWVQGGAVLRIGGGLSEGKSGKERAKLERSAEK